jgi:hypothetical protein
LKPPSTSDDPAWRWRAGGKDRPAGPRVSPCSGDPDLHRLIKFLDSIDGRRQTLPARALFSPHNARTTVPDAPATLPGRGRRHVRKDSPCLVPPRGSWSAP